jgi:RNA polymerase sigma-70 factor (ECF subfamily)
VNPAPPKTQRRRLSSPPTVRSRVSKAGVSVAGCFESPPTNAKTSYAVVAAGQPSRFTFRRSKWSIQSALLTLPFEQRQAILLSDLHGYHYEEIAEMTGSNVGTVKSRIHRGRERLRAMLAEDPELFGRLRRLEQ